MQITKRLADFEMRKKRDIKTDSISGFMKNVVLNL